MLFIAYTLRDDRVRMISARSDAMTDAQVHAAALAAPDAQPLTEAGMA